MLVPSLLFIASFSAIFILLGMSATVIGSALNTHKHALEQIGGVLIIVMGLVFLATPFVGMFNREWHSESLLRLAGRGGPLVAGAAFAIAWTPCTSITLGAILTQAAISSSAAHGALLLAFYSAGLAIPFLLIALAFERMTNALGVVKRHFPVIIGVGGAVMILLGRADPHRRVHDRSTPRPTNLLQGTGLERVERLSGGAPGTAVPTLPGCAWRRARTARSRSP